MNTNIFHIINDLSLNPIVAKIALFLSYPFTYILLILLVIWAIFFSDRKMYTFSLLFLTGISSWIFANILKNILKVNRPFVELGINPLYGEIGFSFPSEHMTVFTALAVAIFLINRMAGFIFFIIAILIGFSRIIIGVHYPIDIIGGLVVGVLIGLICTEIFKKI